MKLIALVEVRTLATNHSRLFLRFQTEEGRSLDLPASTDQVEALLSQMPAPSETDAGAEEEEIVHTPSPLLASTEEHLRLPSFVPQPVEDGDEWGLG